MESFLKFVFDIALLVGVVAQRVIIAISDGIIRAIVQLSRYILSVC